MKGTTFAAIGTVGLAAALLSGCSQASQMSQIEASSAPSSSAGVQPGVNAEQGSERSVIVLDVRTPGEYAQGHLQGALNINVEDPSFASQVSELDPNAEVLVYCRSGNRAGQAEAIMREMGFENVSNLGSVEGASARAGIAVVK